MGRSIPGGMQMAIGVKPGRLDMSYLARCFVSVKVATNQNREIARQAIDQFVQISLLGFIAAGK